MDTEPSFKIEAVGFSDSGALDAAPRAPWPGPPSLPADDESTNRVNSTIDFITCYYCLEKETVSSPDFRPALLCMDEGRRS